MPAKTLSEMITKESQQFADSQKYSAQSFGEKIANMLRFGQFVTLFTAWDDQTEEQLARGYPDHTRRFSDINWWTSSASVKLFLGKHDEYGEATELVEQFEAALIAHDMSFIAPTDFKVVEYSKTRELVYKFNQDGKWEDKYSITIAVCGENSDKCIVITEETGEMTEPKPIMRTRLICAGDAEFAEHMKKEEASVGTQDNSGTESSADIADDLAQWSETVESGDGEPSVSAHTISDDAGLSQSPTSETDEREVELLGSDSSTQHDHGISDSDGGSVSEDAADTSKERDNIEHDGIPF